MKTRVTFLRDVPPYAAGESAGFEEAQALRLRDEGLVALHGPGGGPADDAAGAADIDKEEGKDRGPPRKKPARQSGD